MLADLSALEAIVFEYINTVLQMEDGAQQKNGNMYKLSTRPPRGGGFLFETKHLLVRHQFFNDESCGASGNGMGSKPHERVGVEGKELKSMGGRHLLLKYLFLSLAAAAHTESGMGPRTCCIMARCSRFSCV